MQDIQEAEEFYEEYLEVAPNDNTRYILKYKISKAKQVSLDEQIRILEEYKEREFTERWSYELAKLYYQKGDMKKCLEMCNDIILWFSEGRYVLKACLLYTSIIFSLSDLLSAFSVLFQIYKQYRYVCR